MNRPMRDNLTKAWQNAEYSALGFPVHKRLDTMRNAFRTAVGEHFAVPLTDLLPFINRIMLEGRMDPMNGAALFCINSHEHEKSKSSRLGFLKNFLDLYTAETWQRCAEIEGIAVGTEDFIKIQKIYAEAPGSLTKKLESVKAFCWLRDVERATRPSRLETLLKSFFKTAFNHDPPVPKDDIKTVLNRFDPVAAAKLEADDKAEARLAKLERREAKKDFMAMPKADFLPLLRKAKHSNNLSDTQCALMLMFMLHSREKRHDGDTYIKHPVSVAKLVQQYGGKYLGNDEALIWMATITALLHDAWEENDISSIQKDIHGLLPIEVTEAVIALHKQQGETYFAYLERVSRNKLASVVKLCDLTNNISDMNLEKNIGSSKQAYVYTIAANYMEFRMKNPKDDISVEEFVRFRNLCSDAHFKEISKIADSVDSFDDSGNEIKALKKRPAVHFPHLQAALRGVQSAKDILFKKDKSANAHPRREENPSLHA